MKRHKRTKTETVKVGGTRVAIYPITPKKGAPYWQVSDYTDGTRKLRSFADHAEARRQAGNIARLIAAGEAVGQQMNAPDRASFGRALELLRVTGDALELVAARYAEAAGILGTGAALVEAARFFAKRNPATLPQRTVTEVVAELVAHRSARGKSVRYLEALQSLLGRFATAFQVNIGDVFTGDIQRFFDSLKLAPRSVKNYRTALSTLFSFAQARGYIFAGSNPVAGTEAVSCNGDGVVSIYTPEQIAGLLAAAPDEFKPCIAIGAFAGVRVAEILRLEWRDVDVTGGHIEIASAKAKTASRRLVPITPNLAAWLRPHAKKTGPVWPGSEVGFYNAADVAVAASGVRWQRNGLRHSFISHRLADIQNAAQVALEAGNSPGVIFKNYRELVKPADAKRWFGVRPERPANVITVDANTLVS